MIAKIGKGENLYGALKYNQSKVDQENGKILCTQKIKETLNGQYDTAHFLHSFEPYLIANHKTEKPVLHISLNPDPKDKVSDEKFEAIARDYMQEMGYGNQPYIVFKHTDIDRSHIHIVSTSVAITGEKISDQFDHPRSMTICRKLEKKYNLTPATEKKGSQNDKIFSPVDYQKGDIKSQIASVVRHLPKYYKFQSLGEYNALLSLFNITSEEVKGEFNGITKQGLVYFALNENGEKTSNPFKASLFGKNAEYLALQKYFEQCKNILNSDNSKLLLLRSIEIAMHISADEEDFKRHLIEQGINTVVRKNSSGRIYGITFIDHSSKNVWNGSSLNKSFSANVFNEWWNHQNRKEVKSVKQPDTAESPKKKYARETVEKPHHLFDFISNTGDSYTGSDSGFLESLGVLLPQSQGEDYDELVFENQIKKKKKLKSRRKT